MTRSKWMVVILVLLLAAMVPVLVIAQGGERTGTVKLVRGERPQPVTDVARAAAPVAAPKAVLPRTPAQKLGLAPAETHFRVREGFEATWPNGPWDTFDNNGATGGDLCWDDENWIAFKGSWSAWAAGGCADGLDPNFDYYVDYMDSWMTIGPFSTEPADAGHLTFRYWNNSEEGWDYFYWCASVDSWNWYCNYHTGTTNGRWKIGRLNLNNVPGYGSMLGYPDVWVAFIFQSDSIISYGYDGPFVDNVHLRIRR